MRAIVTGGAGFIGSNIVDALLERGDQVTILDDLSRGYRKNLNPAADWQQIDICQPEVSSVFASFKPQVVFHQAALANVREAFREPLEYARVNVLGSLNLIELSRREGVRKFIYASTGGAVYGEPEYLPVKEDHPIHPRDPYGASKHHVEHYLELYKINFGLDYTILRYPNVYGPRQDPSGEAGVIAIFAKAMLEGRQPRINGDGLQERDFVFVSDIVEANLAAVEKGSQGIYNLGSARGINVRQVFEILKQVTTYPGEAVHGPAQAGEVRKITLDARAARQDLNWTPRVELEEGCRRTVEWLRAEALRAN